MGKKKGGAKGKTQRVDKAPPTPSSAHPQQQNSTLPSPEKTPPTSPSAPVADLPAVSTTLDADVEPTTKEASVAEAESGVAELQLPTPSEPDVPLPSVTEGDGVPASQQEPAIDSDINDTEPQPDDSVSANLDAFPLPETENLGAEDLLEAGDHGEANGPVEAGNLVEAAEIGEATNDVEAVDHPGATDTGEAGEDLLETTDTVDAGGLLEATDAVEAGNILEASDPVGTGNLRETGDFLEAAALTEPAEPITTLEYETEIAIDAGIEGDPMADDVQPLEELHTSSQPTAEFDESLSPPRVDEVPIDEGNIEEKPEEPLLQASAVAAGEDQDDAIGLSDLGEQKDQEVLQGWGDWPEESTGEQLDEALVDFNESAGASVLEVAEEPEAYDDTGSGELFPEVAPASNEEQEHVEDLNDVVQPSSQADGSPLLDATATTGEESHVEVDGWVEEADGWTGEADGWAEQIGDSAEQPLEGWDEIAAFENEISTEDAGDPIEQAPMDDHIMDVGENHELDITEEGGAPIELAPAGNHLDTGETHEQDITEAVGDPLEEVPADEDHVAVDTSRNADMDLAEDAGDLFNQAPTSDSVVDTSQDPGLDLESNVHDVSDSRQEGTSLAEVQSDQIGEQTAEGIDPNVSFGDWGIDGISGEAESGSAQQPDGWTTLADGDGTAVEDVHAEGAEGTAAIEDVGSTERNPDVQAADTVDSDAVLAEPIAHAGSEPDIAALEEETHPGELKEDVVEPPPSDEGSNPPPPPTPPAEDAEELQSEEPNVEAAPVPPPEPVDLQSHTAPEEVEGVASSQAEGSELPEELHESSTTLPPTDSMPEAEQIPPSVALDHDLRDSSNDAELAPPSEEQLVEVTAEMVEIAETEDHIDTQMDEPIEAPPAIQLNDTSVTSLTNGIAIMGQESSLPVLSAQDVATPEIIAISEMFGTMRAALLAMTSAFDRLGVQTERMAADSLHIKAAEQLGSLKAALGHQIARQKSEVEALRLTLQSKIKQAAEEKIRTHLRDVIKKAVKAQVEEKVRAQMAIQIPDDLRQQVISHQRKIIQVKTDLHNSEARMYNALQTVPGARLRPLLRPLTTPEQSPVAINISRSNSMGNATLGTPWSAFPSGPAPTPIRRSVSNSNRMGGGVETVPPTPSKFFPRDLTALFALSQDEARRLLREYGLKSTAPSPAVENHTPMRARGLSVVSEEGPVEEDPEVHAQDMNTFMKHIGVPFLMIPPPKEKPEDEHEKPPLSSRSRRKMLTPLIIK